MTKVVTQIATCLLKLQTESDCNSTVSKIENILDDRRLSKIDENIKETVARTFAAEKQLNHTQRVNEAVTDITKHGTEFDEKFDKIVKVFTKIVETKLQENAAMVETKLQEKAAMVETKLNILMKDTKTYADSVKNLENSRPSSEKAITSILKATKNNE